MSSERPFRDIATDSLISALDRQQCRGETFDSKIVWELIERLSKFEAMRDPRHARYNGKCQNDACGCDCHYLGDCSCDFVLCGNFPEGTRWPVEALSCPRCDGELGQVAAVSHTDNTTSICTTCRRLEALELLDNGKVMEQSGWHHPGTYRP